MFPFDTDRRHASPLRCRPVPVSHRDCHRLARRQTRRAFPHDR